MRTFIVIFLAVLASFAVAEFVLNAEFKEASDKCIASSGVDKDLLARARKNNFVEDDKLMNYYSCVFQKMGMRNNDGTLKSVVIIEKLPGNLNKENATKAIAKCIKTDTTTPSKAAYDVIKCFISTMSKKP